jgi:hypothetical protein
VGERQQRPPLFFPLKKSITQKPKNKLNSDCTIKFISINTSKQDDTCIYLDKVISEPHNG